MTAEEVELAADWVADVGKERMGRYFGGDDVGRLRRLCEGDDVFRRHVLEAEPDGKGGRDWDADVLVDRAEEIASEHDLGTVPGDAADLDHPLPVGTVLAHSERMLVQVVVGEEPEGCVEGTYLVAWFNRGDRVSVRPRLWGEVDRDVERNGWTVECIPGDVEVDV